MFARNVAVLQQLGPYYVKTVHNNYGNIEPKIPYVLACGTYQGKPACIETFMPDVPGGDLDDKLAALGPEHIEGFCLKTLLLLSDIEEQGVVQIEPKLGNLGYNGITRNVSMIDFGNAYSAQTADWHNVTLTKEAALVSGINTFSTELCQVTRRFSTLSKLDKALKNLTSHKYESYYDVFMEVQGAVV